MEKPLLKQLKKEERYLRKQIKAAIKVQKTVEKRGCYSDKELAEKDSLLDQQKRQIQSFQQELLQIQKALRLGD